MNSFTLKIFALVFMFIDHIGLYIPDMPIYLRWIGRLSAPIFIFCFINGCINTKNKGKRIFNLYIFSIIMSFIQYVLNIDSNILRTLFSTCIIIYLIDSYRNKDSEFKKHLLLYIAWQLIGIFNIIFLINQMWIPENMVIYILPALLGNIFNLEGGLVFVCLGVLIYLTKDNKYKLSIAYISFCLIYFMINATAYTPVLLGYISNTLNLPFLSEIITYILDYFIGLSPMHMGGGSVFTYNYVWMMIGAIPFMLAYNGERGKSFKYFFYIFYPAHILILFYIGQMV